MEEDSKLEFLYQGCFLKGNQYTKTAILILVNSREDLSSKAFEFT